MNKLIFCSYLCAAGATIMWVLIAFDILDSVHSVHDEDLFFIFLLIPPVLQFFYSRKISKIVDLRPFKASSSLDDFAINEMELDSAVISNSLGWKASLTINSLLLCGFVLSAAYTAPFLVDQIFRQRYDEPTDYALPLFPIVGALAIPTLIFNLRTFNIQRIGEAKVSSEV